MKEEWSIIQILRHSRHDWLNVMQLIKGNLVLQKYDRIEEIIQEVIYQTQHESKLSNLNIPFFASKILVMNWEKENHFQIGFEVIGESRNLASFEGSLLNLLDQLIISLNQSCDHYGENHLQLTIELFEDELPRLTFDFHGRLIDRANIKKMFGNTKNWNEKLELSEFEINEKEFYITFVLIDESKNVHS